LRRGSAIASWLLDLTAAADSGEGRWTIDAAIDEGVPVPVLSTALYDRFSSRAEADYQDKLLLSAMRLSVWRPRRSARCQLGGLRNLLAHLFVFCVVGYQAHRSRCVKTATDGCHHRVTYTNKAREHRQISSNIVSRQCAHKVPKAIKSAHHVFCAVRRRC
jgi:6-phosphogluconate dehydrogenase